MTANLGADGSADNGDGEGDDGHSSDQGNGDGQGEGGEQVRDPEAVLRNNEKLTTELKASRAKVAKMEAEAESNRVAALSEHEQAIEKARQEGADATRVAMQSEIVQEQIRARATGVLADPDDAVTFIDASEIEYGDDAAIKGALEALVKAKPHLAGKGAKKGIDQGPQGTSQSGDTGNDWMRRSLGR